MTGGFLNDLNKAVEKLEAGEPPDLDKTQPPPRHGGSSKIVRGPLRPSEARPVQTGFHGGEAPEIFLDFRAKIVKI